MSNSIESKRLEIGEKKSHKIHIGKGRNRDLCPQLKVHGKDMENSVEDKYVGDIITGDGKNDKNIISRRSKGYGIAGDILAILEEVPFGIYKVEAGITMRNSMLINGMLTNSEVWYGLTEKDISMLEEVDLYLLRKILKAHSKTPKEMLYLETGVLRISFILKQRRLSY